MPGHPERIGGNSKPGQAGSVQTKDLCKLIFNLAEMTVHLAAALYAAPRQADGFMKAVVGQVAGVDQALHQVLSGLGGAELFKERLSESRFSIIAGQ